MSKVVEIVTEGELFEVMRQRDQAMDCLEELCALVGFHPEWSNLYGYREALDEVATRLDALKKDH